MKRLLLGAAVVYALGAALLPPDVFLLGDGGVKSVQVRSLLATGLRGAAPSTLVDPFPELHPRGAFFPFAPPFAYQDGERFASTFPAAFPAVSAPLFAVFGWRGLRVLPALSALGLLLLVARLARALGFPRRAAAALGGLVALGTPLALYAVQFWEHVPFAACVVASLTLAVEATLQADGGRRAFASGLVIALGALLREEAVVFAGALVVALLVVRGPAGAWAGGAAAGFVLVLVFNRAATGHALGFHGLQLAADLAAGDPDSGARAATHLARAGTQFRCWVSQCPLVLLALVAGAWSRDAGRGVRLVRVIFLTSTLAILALAPNDGGTPWGPRYLLAEIPLVVVLAAVVVRGCDARLRRGVGAVAALFAAAGVVAVGFGAAAIAHDLAGVKALVETVRAERPQAVVTSNAWIAQELSALWFDVPVLRAGTADVPAAVATLRAAGRRRVLRVEWTSSVSTNGQYELDWWRDE